MKARHIRLLKFFCLVLVLCVSLLIVAIVKIHLANALTGSDWRAGRIIDDNLFTNPNGMSVAQIQSFLESKVPSCDTNGTQMVGGETRAQYGTEHGNPPPFTCLKDYYENPGTTADNYGGQPIPAGAKSAAQLIWEAAQQYNISPQTLLITLQKEQALVTDDWPFKVQYQKAMGADCPDTAPCDPAYADFSKQMLEGAKLFRSYLDNMNQPWWPYAKPGARSILYNPDSNCGSSTIFIENPATAALYTYTPYQPNSAALANLNGTGDGCSAYGNRNFWRDYNNWFGPSTSNGYTLAIADNGDPRQWVVMNGKRYLVPDPSIIKAWGLPSTPITWDDQYLGSFPDGPNLGRLMRPGGSLNLYLVADGKRYRIPNTQMLDLWNLSIGNLVDVASGLGELPTDSGDLTYTAQLSGNPAVYLMDSGKKDHIQDGNVLKAIAGDTPFISIFTATNDSYFSSLAAGPDIGSPKISDGTGKAYLLDSGRKLALDNTLNSLYPGGATSVTPAVYNYFGTQQMTYLIRAWNSSDVYLIDTTKHHIIDPDVLDAWQSATYPSWVTVTSMGLRDFINNGTDITDYYASNGSNKYLIDKWQHSIDPSLQAAYTASRAVYPASNSLVGLFPAGSAPTGLVKSSVSSAVYVLTNASQRRWLTSPNKLALWQGSQAITTLRMNNINRYIDGGGIGAFVTDGTTNYIIEGGTKHSIDSTTKSNWALGTPETLSDGTLDRMSSGLAIPNKLQSSGAYYLVHEGGAFVTADRNIAGMWGIDDAPTLNPALAGEFLSVQMLTRIAHSRNDSRIFIEDHGQLYRLYPNTAGNLNAQGPFTWIDPNNFTVNDWTATVVKDEGGTYYAIDGGTKRLMPTGPIQSAWTNGGTASVPTVSNGFLNTLPTVKQIERAIKGSGPNIYYVDNLQKRLIQNPNTYATSYAPYANVSDALLSCLPDGNPI